MITPHFSIKGYQEVRTAYNLSAVRYNVYDGGQLLLPDSVTVVRTPTRSEVHIPLTLLGNPEQLMVSAQTLVRDVPLENIPWVFLAIGNQ